MKLVLDEMWNATIARELRRHGHDVIAIQEAPHARYAGLSTRRSTAIGEAP